MMKSLKNLDLPYDFDKMSPKEIVERNYDKKYWEKGAQRLRLLEMNQIHEIIPEMLTWLQDLNWPGSNEIMDILVSLPRLVLLNNLEQTIKIAIYQDDQEWLFFIAMFLKINKIIITKNDFKDEKIYESIVNVNINC